MYQTRPERKESRGVSLNLGEIKVRKTLAPPSSTHGDKRRKRESSRPKRDRWRED